MSTIFGDKAKRVKAELDRTERVLNENFDKLPTEDLPFMEPDLRALYFQAYFLAAYGFYNASLVIQGILLESLIKQLLLDNGVHGDELEEMEFGKAYGRCIELSLLDTDEQKFLKDKKDELRNPYSHHNLLKLTRKYKVPVSVIDNPVEIIKGLTERVSKGELTVVEAREELLSHAKPGALETSETMRPLGIIIKSKIDALRCIPTFLEIDAFVRKFAEKHFGPQEHSSK